MPQFKTIIEYDTVAVFDVGDYFLLWDTETGTTRKVLPNTVANLLGGILTVNGKSGDANRAVTLETDDIPEGSGNKFVTAAEKALLALIRDDLASTVFLAGDGVYRVPQVPQAQSLFIRLDDNDPGLQQADAELNGSVQIYSEQGTLLNLDILKPAPGVIDITTKALDASGTINLNLSSIGNEMVFVGYDGAGYGESNAILISHSGAQNDYHTVSIKVTQERQGGSGPYIALIAIGEKAN